MAKSRGQPKKFKEDEFKEYVFEYLNEIYDMQSNGGKDTPTFFGFYRFVNKKKECSYHTIRRCFDEYWADIKKEFEEIRADLLSRGAMLGVYNSTMTIFGLKNWCGWKDNPQTELDNEDTENTLAVIKECAYADRDKS